MITFLDGPAQGVKLNLRRAPIMLRVVQSSRQAWDALNEPEDDPSRDETVHVYIRVGPVTTFHVKSAKRSMSGWHSMASYRHFPDQHAGEHTCNAVAWAAWCDANKPALLELKREMEASL